ncbi:hypothetical protein [Solicola sp. PLA-1-18]|uniref:hypothetical protein n=1 Tax=Solicola sp. PLA-1-18 TaxID=3380532 RepID=UPI003B780BD3
MTEPSDHHDAIDGIRRQARQQWALVANDVLEHAMRATRTSLPLRAHTPEGPIWIAEQVVIAALRRAIDDDLDGGAVGRVVIDADTEHVVHTLTIELFGQFGYDLLVLADQARATAERVLWDSLQLDQVDIAITPLHMHFTAVTYGDPQQVDPSDEF